MKCPGQDTQFWTQNAIFEAQCPECGHTVEFFKDDTTRKCGNCGHRFINPKMDFGCAAYCPFAEQCLGDLPPELVAQQENLLKDRVAVAVKRHLKADFKRIGRAGRRAYHAEKICPAEGGHLAPVLIAAYLFDLDADPGAAGDLPVARDILADLRAPEPLVDKVAELIAAARGGRRNGDGTPAIVADAAAIADWEETQKQSTRQAAESAAATTAALQTAQAKKYFQELSAKTGN